jgi:hypothetical protein
MKSSIRQKISLVTRTTKEYNTNLFLSLFLFCLLVRSVFNDAVSK